ncbi:MAG: outer membrane beta-barrel protein [Flavobacteriales bacterium]|nr:outer membrane beta-barrel protein [Flavobacteriales bacterium]
MLLPLTGLRAQQSELGLTAGVMYYIGDLNPGKHYPKDTKFAAGVLYRYNFDSRYALRIQGLYGTLQAYDSDSPDTLQLIRNLHFRSRVFELSALLEINFFKYRVRDKDARTWTPFVFGGLAYYRINPKAQLNDTWYELQPLGTEGQGTSGGPKAYKLDQICLPFGAGLKFNFNRVDLQLEWGLRRTYTDYIDDVSGRYVDNDKLTLENGPLAAQLADRSELRTTGFNTGRARGNINTRDWYQYTGFTLTVLVGNRFQECDALFNRKR